MSNQQLIFLSHASQDKPAVRRLSQRLKADGFDPWLDEERILPGQDWNLEIEKAMRLSGAILLCFSALSVAKEGYIQREYKRAMQYQEEKPEGTIFVIPVRLDDCAMPHFIQELQWVDYPGSYDRLALALDQRADKLEKSPAKSKKEEKSAQRVLIMGSQTNYTITQVIQLPGFVPPPNSDALRRAYLAHLQGSYHALDFKGIPQLRTLTAELSLEEVYVPLLARPELPEGETWERRLAGRQLDKTSGLPEEMLAAAGKGGSAAPVRIEEALREKTQLVVLGDPGSGKSTMLKHLALSLVGEKDAPLPILVPLNAYARALAQRDINLQAFLAIYFAGRAEGMANLSPLFEAALANGQSIVLLDGLDEVQSGRAALVQRVEAFAREVAAKKNKIVVTSRIVGYRNAPLNPKTWTLHTLLDFGDREIEAFAAKWCLAFERSTLGDTPEAHRSAETERGSLLEAVRANPGVARLASNPLLLTILALIKRQGVELPRSRVKLYDRYLETLIEAWNHARALDKSAGGESLEYESTLDVLGPLALRLREENPFAGLVSGRQLLQWLAEYYTSEQWGLKPGPAREKAETFLQSVHMHSNLLVERGEGQYGFIHLTFEEALAAYGLVSAGQIERGRSIEIIHRHLTDPAWRETILLAVGVWGLLHRQPLAAGEVVRGMLTMDCSGENACQNVLLAGACLEDVGEAGLGRAAASEVIDALITVSLNRELPPATQREAGFSLGRLAGNNPDFLARIRPDLETWLPIPAGGFLYGDEKEKVVIKEPFSIAKYPVTNLQYRKFIEAAGYDRQEYWSTDGWLWRTGKWDTKADKPYQDWLKGRPLEKRGEPFYWHDPKWNNPLAPAVGVSWFEAEAYANWLSQQLGHPVRLPTEQEWERAARGEKGREYAWGNEFNRNQVNCAEFWGQEDDLSEFRKWNEWYESDSFKQASTTFVGQFPTGATPEGVCDLSGNVWEWVDSWIEEEQINRVFRGDAWSYFRRNCRCACRDWLVPDLFSSYVGFRLVSPGSDLSPKRSAGDISGS